MFTYNVIQNIKHNHKQRHIIISMIIRIRQYVYKIPPLTQTHSVCTEKAFDIKYTIFQLKFPESL